MSESSLRFDVHPSVVFKLGEELITDEIQAIVELVKNAYDADASYATVTIRTSDVDAGDHGLVEIEDDGTGMSLREIREGWLTISYSSKLQMKERGETTPI